MICGGPDLTDEALQQLRPLTQLSSFAVDADADKTTEAAMSEFLAAMPTLDAVCTD
jgi:hypothetical protein